MREDLLKERLMSYARSAAEVAAQPGTAAIHRRARRHYRRVAALTVAGVLAAAGLGVGIGLGRDPATPTVDQPGPPVTSPDPGVKPPATPAPPPGGSPQPTTTTAAARPPSSFVTLVGPADPSATRPLRVAVVSTATGEVVRYLTGPPPAGTDLHRPALSPDRAWVYYSLSGSGAKAGTYRVPFGGGPATRVTRTAGWTLAVSPDGSKLLLDARSLPGWRYGLVVLDLASGRERFMAFPFEQAGEVFGYAWSPDSRQIAVVRGPVFDGERFPTRLYLLEVASGRWRTAVTFGARGPAPVFGELCLAWPAPRRVAFVARTADSDAAPGRYRLVEVDPQSGKLASLGPFLASDPSPAGRVTLRFLDFDPGGRYLLYGVDGLSLTTRWLDRSGKGAPVTVGRFDALPGSKETRAYESGAW